MEGFAPHPAGSELADNRLRRHDSGRAGQHVIFRSARSILLTDVGITMFSVVTSLIGARALGRAGAARFIFFAVQATGFAGFWFGGRLTVASAAFVMIASQTASMLLSLYAVLSQLRPRWRPSWTQFRTSMHYGLRDYLGGLADYATLRLDQLMLGAMASSSA